MFGWFEDVFKGFLNIQDAEDAESGEKIQM
jgi:hypothetical protein